MDESLNELRRLVKVLSYQDFCARSDDEPSGYRPFITISREAGAGAHTLAHALLERFERENAPLFRGWQIIDRDLCERVAGDYNLRASVQSLVGEEYRSQIEDAILTMLGQTPRDVVMRRIFETIRTLGSVGKVIIVGRCGMCVTRDLPGALHLRLVASESSRTARMMRLLKIPQARAKQVVENHDRDRARLVSRYFMRSIDDPLLYDAIWNTDATPIAAIAEAAVALLRYRESTRHKPWPLACVNEAAEGPNPSW
jgi:cytidylate kinase